MQKYLLVILSFISFHWVTAQVTFSPDPVEISADAASSDNIQVDFQLTNEGSDTLRLAWRLEVESQDEAWSYYVCDTEICYNLNVSESSLDKPNIFAPEESRIIMFHALPNGVEAEGKYNIHFFDVSKPDSILVTVPVTVSTLTASTKSANIIKGLSIFPNPTSDYFRINTGDLVDYIDIRTVTGTKIISYKTVPGGYYDISHLRTGIYYARLVDKRGDSIKVLKLQKN